MIGQYILILAAPFKMCVLDTLKSQPQANPLAKMLPKTLSLYEILTLHLQGKIKCPLIKSVRLECSVIGELCEIKGR